MQRYRHWNWIMYNEEFEKKIGYKFKDKDLLEKALTHSSYCRENGLSHKACNERLEFVGDAFLDAILGEDLYLRMESDGEGPLTKTRAAVVCEQSLARVGRKLDVGRFLNMGHGEVNSGGRERQSIIADATEAVIGAIFMDGGYEAVRTFVKREFADITRDALNGALFSDYKTMVQEILQKEGVNHDIRYVLDREEGPDHDKTFFVHLACDGRALGSGMGKSKKEAEQNAAKDTIDGGLI